MIKNTLACEQVLAVHRKGTGWEAWFKTFSKLTLSKSGSITWSTKTCHWSCPFWGCFSFRDWPVKLVITSLVSPLTEIFVKRTHSWNLEIIRCQCTIIVSLNRYLLMNSPNLQTIWLSVVCSLLVFFVLAFRYFTDFKFAETKASTFFPVYHKETQVQSS